MKPTWKTVLIAGISTCTLIALASILSLTMTQFSESGNQFFFRFEVEDTGIELEAGVTPPMLK